MELIAFYFFSILAVGSALFIVWTKNLMYAAFALFITLVGVAALYVLAGADFLAVTQLMIYVGGILVLLIFGIMLTRKPQKQENAFEGNYIAVSNSRRVWALVVSVGLFLLFTLTLLAANFTLTGEVISIQTTLPKFGMALMTSHLLPFEIAGILLLVALVGAAYLAVNRNPAE
jgi:NADH:ubiquinone oxidoreductase subunit 6 (subunit J)